jgi:hypothetical protein
MTAISLQQIEDVREAGPEEAFYYRGLRAIGRAIEAGALIE